jgi:DNA-binding transcriptional LysR family regulator
MELRWLAAFSAVAEELNFRRAAEKLYVAQPAVSQQIMSLERELGVKLFERTKRSVRLTDAGAAFLEPSRQVLAGVESAGRLARNAGTGEYGTIRIGFNAGFTTDDLVTLVQVIRRDHPHLELVFDSTRTTTEILKSLDEDRLDIALVGGPVTGKQLRRREIGQVKLAVLLSDSHPLSARDAIDVGQLAGENLILVDAQPGWSIRRLVQDALDRGGVTPAAVTIVADATTMIAFVAAGIGIGFASLNTATLTPRNLTLITLDNVEATPISAVWKEANESPALNTVIAAIDRYLI